MGNWLGKVRGMEVMRMIAMALTVPSGSGDVERRRTELVLLVLKFGVFMANVRTMSGSHIHRLLMPENNISSVEFPYVSIHFTVGGHF
jgi:hypothetical protein